MLACIDFLGRMSSLINLAWRDRQTGSCFFILLPASPQTPTANAFCLFHCTSHGETLQKHTVALELHKAGAGLGEGEVMPNALWQSSGWIDLIRPKLNQCL